MLIEPSPKKNSEFGKFMQNGQPQCYIGSAHDYLHKHLKNYDETENIHFTSNGRFALHDIAIYYARKHGPVNVIFSSFNLSVPAARKLIRAWNYGLFTSLQFILNQQKRSNFRSALNLVEGKFKLKFTAVHAKVALIYNEKINITALSSGNLSANQNIERGLVCFDKQTFEFDYQWMTDILEE